MKPVIAASDASPSARSSAQQLVIIIGPIASGKSTLAEALADRLRHSGRTVALVGLDTIAEMALPTLHGWSWAHEVHAKVVGAWLATSVHTVIAEGPGSAAEVQQLMHHVHHDVDVLRVLLESEYEAGLRRVDADPTRGVSRNPEFLAEEYRRWDEESPRIPCDLRLDTAQTSPGALAESVIAAMRGGSAESSASPDA